mgnify:CR=1 FL=1
MRAVLYAYDLEPITVIDVPTWAHELMERQRYFSLPVLEKLPVPYTIPHPELAETRTLRIVHITCEKLQRNGWTRWMLFTNDEESGLLLQAAFLPGQVGEVRRKQEQAFAVGFWSALQGGF